jgi:hypothetical protein
VRGGFLRLKLNGESGRRGPETVRARSGWLLLACLLGLSCSGPPAPPLTAVAPGEWRSFEGSWTATGTRHTLPLEPGRQASTFNLSGSLLLSGQRGLGVGFRAEVIGLADSQEGGLARAVWTDERGDRVFSVLRGSALGTGVQVTGTIVGGTGRYAGVTGEYELRWRWVVQTDEGTISGRTDSLKGRAKLAAAAASQ